MYQALYRKWRPKSFDDVVSQPYITTALKNQIASGKTAHAYLFTGSRGTGKTTCARIFAKAVNCPNAADGEPCLECKICKNADNGALADIIEIDAASNASVNDIRELREGVLYTPEICKYKVYIIDEVHMLSTGAFNALLKIMEEPPPHVKFILATTEVHKVPATIVSRCQHFDFNRIKSEDIVARLEYIATQESFSLDKKAAQMIARLSDGGMRDALSLLDQCAAVENNVTLDTVSSVSGIAGRDYLFDLIDCVVEKKAAEAIKIINQLYDMSKDLKVLTGELLEQMRNVMLIKAIGNSRELITCLPEEYDRLSSISQRLTIDEILRDINILQESSAKFAKSSSKRIEMEMCFVKLCSNMAIFEGFSSGQLASISGRLDELENSVKSYSGNYAANVHNTPVQNSSNSAKTYEKPVKQADPDFKNVDPKQATPAQNWENIVMQINEKNKSIGAFLKKSKAFILENNFFLIVDNDFFLKLFKETNAAAVLNEALKNNYGKTFNIKVKSAKNVIPEDAENPINQLLQKAQKLNIEVEIK